jgi:hypothetical protein
MRLVIGRFTLSFVVLAVAFSSAAVAARADDTSVKAAIKTQDHALDHFLKQNPQINQLLNGTLKTSQLGATVHLFRAYAGKLDHAGVIVAKPKASTPAGAAGQKDWVSGIRELADGMTHMATAVKDGLHGNKAAAKREIRAMTKAIAVGNKLGYKADHELKLPKGA